MLAVLHHQITAIFHTDIDMWPSLHFQQFTWAWKRFFFFFFFHYSMLGSLSQPEISTIQLREERVRASGQVGFLHGLKPWNWPLQCKHTLVFGFVHSHIQLFYICASIQKLHLESMTNPTDSKAVSNVRLIWSETQCCHLCNN